MIDHESKFFASVEGEDFKEFQTCNKQIEEMRNIMYKVILMIKQIWNLLVSTQWLIFIATDQFLDFEVQLPNIIINIETAVVDKFIYY